MTDAPYLFTGDHADTLESGRPIEPGETVPASAVSDADRDRLPLVAFETPVLAGDALAQRAADLGIEGRSQMSAAQLRRAVAKAEQAQADPNPDTDQEG